MGVLSDIFGGSFLDSALNISEQRRSNERAMDFSAAQSETAYQRATTDMIAAGLNPALMYSGGASPAAAIGGQAAAGRSDIFSAQKLKAEAENIEEQTKILKGGVMPKVLGTDVMDDVKGGLKSIKDKILDMILPDAPNVGSHGGKPIPPPSKDAINSGSAVKDYVDAKRNRPTDEQYRKMQEDALRKLTPEQRRRFFNLRD